MVLVVTAVAAPFHRAQLRKLLLPIAKHMRLDTAQIADFTDREVALGGDGWERIIQLNQCAKTESSKSTLSSNFVQSVCWFFWECCFVTPRQWWQAAQ